MSRKPKRTCLSCGRTVRGSTCSACLRDKEKVRHARQPWRGAYRGAGHRTMVREVRARAGDRCEGCGIDDEASRSAFGRPLEVDHILPLSRGGDNSAANGQLLCRRCHNTKRARQTPQGGVSS